MGLAWLLFTLLWPCQLMPVLEGPIPFYFITQRGQRHLNEGGWL